MSINLLDKSGAIRHFFAAIEWSAGLEEILIVAALLALAIGFAIGRGSRRYQVRAIQNHGEGRLSRDVKTRFRPPDYHLLNHITLRLKDGTTTQIDHILVSRFGVFVIETKDYRGWIFADAKDRYWTQILYRTKFRFQNPIHQNYKHVCAVRDLLDFLEPEVIRPIVVFVGDAEFKLNVPDTVFTLSEFIVHVQGYGTEVMSANRVQFCVGRLETTRLAITEATDVEHVLELRRRHGIND